MDKKANELLSKAMSILGKRTLEKHGKQHFSNIGKEGAKKRWDKAKQKDGPRDNKTNT